MIRRLARFGVWVLGLVGLAAAAYWGLLYYQKTGDAALPRQAGSEGTPPVRVSIDTVASMDIPIAVDGSGTVQGFNTVTVRPRVDGAIVEIGFKEGQSVNAGDILFRIDPRPYKATLDQAKAKLQQSQAQLEFAKLDLERSQQLISRGAVSKQQLDSTQSQVHMLQAQIEADKATIEAAQTQLDYTTIRSPFEGRVGLRGVDVGNIVNAGGTTSLVVVTQIKPIAVIFTLPESSLAPLADAMAKGSVSVIVSGRDSRKPIARGTIDSLDNQIDATTGTIKLKSVLPNADLKLWPGQFVNVRVELDVLRNRIAVPSAAVQRGPEGEFVYVVKPDRTVEARLIQVAVQSDGWAVVANGLQPSERIVTEGAFRLRPGMSVVPAGARRPGQTPSDQRS
jgi:multidrug efflux system membrane fusion protein